MSQNRKFAIFVSGYGRTALQILNMHYSNILNADIGAVISTYENSEAIKFAKHIGIPTRVIKLNEFKNRTYFENEILQYLSQERIENVFLAGFKYLLTINYLSKFTGYTLNIHPSLLPSFKGNSGIQMALDYGVKVTGLTIHQINESMDEGEILMQKCIKIEIDDDFESLDKKFQDAAPDLIKDCLNTYFK